MTMTHQCPNRGQPVASRRIQSPRKRKTVSIPVNATAPRNYLTAPVRMRRQRPRAAQN